MEILKITEENEYFLAKLIVEKIRQELDSFVVISKDESLSFMIYSISRFHAENTELKNLENCNLLTFDKIDNHLRKYRQISLQDWFESI